MLKIHVELRAKCKRHPGYDPHTSGEQGIVGGCTACTALLQIYSTAHDCQRFAVAKLFDPAMPVATISTSAGKVPDEYLAPSTSSITGSAKFRYKDK